MQSLSRYNWLSFVFLFLITCPDAFAWRYRYKKKIIEQTIEVTNLQSDAQAQTPSDELIEKKELKEKACTVNVLLDETHRSDFQGWTINAQTGFHLIPYESVSGIHFQEPEIRLTVQKKTIFINGKKVAHERCSIKPREGYLQFNGRQYHGSFLVDAAGDVVQLINCLDLEEYVYSVLNSESWPGWPLEINKAFAVASRSYVMKRIQEANTKKKLYHIKNTNIHQTYNGVHTSERLREAIDQTRGLIMAYNGKPIEAMFDSCCGGVIPAHITGIDFKSAPYLAREKKCNFCKGCKIFGWRVEYSLEHFQELLKKAGHSVRSIREIKVVKRDKAGVVQRVLIQGSNHALHLNCKQMYALCSKIKSYCFTVEKKGKAICFTGKGYGHHMGICQWGARRMLDAGHHYKSILQFYYPGATLMQMKTTEASV
ncbi:SpoIID/LytB domain-containing protein [Candidatus Dependentiae bacterium]|nr:SpoIID/LytB domain-containing protein [Candidatus Dependentiae bacterium]